MFRPVFVLLSAAALLQTGLASPIASREVATEAEYLSRTDAYHVDASKREPAAQCFCTEDYSPVCVSGKTYSNKCAANCAGAKEFTQGACATDDLTQRAEAISQCSCTQEYSPVCASGKTYSNKCKADCAGAKGFTQGACETPRVKQKTKEQCFCTQDYSPVCVSGKTYSNQCEANCAGTKAFTQGAC